MQFYNPVNLIIGSGVRREIGQECINKQVLLFCTKSAYVRYKQDPVLRELFEIPSLALESSFDSNPSLSDMKEISIKYKDSNMDLIVGLGGGSAMDVAKIACISIPAQQIGLNINDLLTNSEIFSTINAIDCIQVPTTAGTGSEVTPFATVWDYENRQKKSLSNPAMFAKKAFIDPDFLRDTPVEISLSTGLDALNQAFESLWNVNANDYTRLLSKRAIKLALSALPLINEIPKNLKIRDKLSMASLLAGLAISQTRTSICHSISYPLTLKYGIPHGIACAFSMLEVYKYNLEYIKGEIEEIEYSLNRDPFSSLEDIFKHHKLNSYLANALPNKTNFTDSIEEFITEGRFENNIRKCNRKDLFKIIVDSYDKAVS